MARSTSFSLPAEQINGDLDLALPDIQATMRCIQAAADFASSFTAERAIADASFSHQVPRARPAASRPSLLLRPL